MTKDNFEIEMDEEYRADYIDQFSYDYDDIMALIKDFAGRDLPDVVVDGEYDNISQTLTRQRRPDIYQYLMSIKSDTLKTHLDA